jgi:hypothetical protein
VKHYKKLLNGKQNISFPYFPSSRGDKYSKHAAHISIGKRSMENS